MKISDIP
jgi:hypothetical protein